MPVDGTHDSRQHVRQPTGCITVYRLLDSGQASQCRHIVVSTCTTINIFHNVSHQALRHDCTTVDGCTTTSLHSERCSTIVNAVAIVAATVNRQLAGSTTVPTVNRPHDSRNTLTTVLTVSAVNKTYNSQLRPFGSGWCDSKQPCT